MDIITTILEFFYSIAEIYKEPNKSKKQKLQLLAVFIMPILILLLIITFINNQS